MWFLGVTSGKLLLKEYFKSPNRWKVIPEIFLHARNNSLNPNVVKRIVSHFYFHIIVIKKVINVISNFNNCEFSTVRSFAVFKRLTGRFLTNVLRSFKPITSSSVASAFIDSLMHWESVWKHGDSRCFWKRKRSECVFLSVSALNCQWIHQATATVSTRSQTSTGCFRTTRNLCQLPNNLAPSNTCRESWKLRMGVRFTVLFLSQNGCWNCYLLVMSYIVFLLSMRFKNGFIMFFL